MSFKEYLKKKVIPTYFMIVTFIILGMAIAGLILYRNARIGILTLLVPPVFGVIGCLPLLLDFVFMKVKSSGIWLILYNAAELVILEACILTAAYFIGIIDAAFTAAVIAVMVFAIFSAVGAIMYIQDKSFCDSVNDALAKYAANAAK